MENNKRKLTLDELIEKAAAKKGLKRSKNRATLYIKSIDRTIVLEEPGKELIADCTEMEAYEGDEYLVYKTVVDPKLTDKELLEAAGVAAPPEIVSCIFSPGEVSYIAKQAMKLAGFEGGNVTLVDEIKN